MRVYGRVRRQRLRVRVVLQPADTRAGTGHGNMWRRVLTELTKMDDVTLTRRGRADVWLANGHDEPPDGRPLVAQIHEIGWQDHELRAYLDPAFSAQMERSTRATLDVATRVITPSESSRRQVVETHGWRADRVHAVPHGVDHSRFRPGVGGGRELVGAPYVLFVGVLHPRKNVAAVRTAVASLARSGLPHALAVVGSPAGDRRDTSELDDEATAELPGLPGRIVGFRRLSEQDVATLMGGADAFCLPSFFEGFGLPVLESMACGTPVVVSNRGALPDLVRDAGVVVEPEAAAVEGALRRVLTEPALAESLSRAGRKRAAAFTWQRTAQGWLEVLKAAA